jgi:lipoate synthase
VDAAPDVVSHNLETIERLTPQIRSKAQYRSSLEVLKYLADNGMKTKSGIMVGLGETKEEVIQVMGRFSGSQLQSDYHWSIPSAFAKKHESRTVCNT